MEFFGRDPVPNNVMDIWTLKVEDYGLGGVAARHEFNDYDQDIDDDAMSMQSWKPANDHAAEMGMKD